MKNMLILSAAVAALSLTSGVVVAAEQQEVIYGSHMMTQQERVEYRARMRAANTEEERLRIRAEHHERMKERARERGVTIPDEPPPRGMGGGMGPGMGGGMGPGMGGGMGGGRGR
jgi:hypothetical protein